MENPKCTIALLYLKMHWLRFNFLRGYLYNASSRTYNFLKITALIPQQLSDKMSHCSVRIHHSASQIWHKLLIHVKLCMYIPLSSQWVSFIFAKLMMILFCLLSSPASFFFFPFLLENLLAVSSHSTGSGWSSLFLAYEEPFLIANHSSWFSPWLWWCGGISKTWLLSAEFWSFPVLLG